MKAMNTEKIAVCVAKTGVKTRESKKESQE